MLEEESNLRADGDAYFNVLTLDGGGIRGIISAVVIGRMEEFAWQYADQKGYRVPTHLDKDGKMRTRMHMSDLFNMTGGTSTGSLIAAALAVPTMKGGQPTTVPSYYSADIVKIYEDDRAKIFTSQEGSFIYYVITCHIVGFIFGIFSYRLGREVYDNKSIEKLYTNL